MERVKEARELTECMFRWSRREGPRREQYSGNREEDSYYTGPVESWGVPGF